MKNKNYTLLKETNIIKAIITKIQNIENLNLVSFMCDAIELKIVTLELQNTLKVGSEVFLKAKASSISISKKSEKNAHLSFENQLNMKIEKIEFGQILTSIQLRNESFSLESIITTNTAQTMQLKEDDCVIALINATDIAIAEIL